MSSAQENAIEEIEAWEKLVNVALDAAEVVIERADRVAACSVRMREQCIKNLLHSIKTKLKPALNALEHKP